MNSRSTQEAREGAARDQPKTSPLGPPQDGHFGQVPCRGSLPVLRSLGVGVLGLGIVIAPAGASAQSVEWTAGPVILFDTDFVDGTEIGPGLFLDVVWGPRRNVSYFASISAARTRLPGRR